PGGRALAHSPHDAARAGPGRRAGRRRRYAARPRRPVRPGRGDPVLDRRHQRPRLFDRARALGRPPVRHHRDHLGGLVRRPAGSPPNASTLVGRAVQTTVQGTSTANISAARIETQTLGGSWQPLAVLPAVTTGSGWTAIGDVVTAGLPAGTYSLRAVAIAPNGS